MPKIKNDRFELSVSTRGAEIESLAVDFVEIMWQRNDLWNAQSPILFPIVGSLKDEYYEFKGKTYHLPCHGFAKDMEYEIEEQGTNYIVLSTKYTENTLEMYPFQFLLKIRYDVLENGIHISFMVENLDSKEMPFCLGFHPGFSYAGLKQVLGDNIHLDFYNSKAKKMLFSPTYIQQEKPIGLSSISLTDFSKILVKERTICYQGITSFELKANKKKMIIRNEMPYISFWQKQPENPRFICIEPWEGHPDWIDTDHKLEGKKQYYTIQPNQIYKSDFKIIIE